MLQTGRVSLMSEKIHQHRMLLLHRSRTLVNMILYDSVNNFQSCRDEPSCVGPVESSGYRCLICVHFIYWWTFPADVIQYTWDGSYEGSQVRRCKFTRISVDK